MGHVGITQWSLTLGKQNKYLYQCWIRTVRTINCFVQMSYGNIEGKYLGMVLEIFQMQSLPVLSLLTLYKLLIRYLLWI